MVDTETPTDAAEAPAKKPRTRVAKTDNASAAAGDEAPKARKATKKAASKKAADPAPEAEAAATTTTEPQSELPAVEIVTHVVVPEEATPPLPEPVEAPAAEIAAPELPELPVAVPAAEAEVSLPEPVVEAPSEPVVAVAEAESPAPLPQEEAAAANEAPAGRPPREAPKAEAPFPEEISVRDMQAMSPADLLALAEKVGWRTNASRTKHQQIFDLMGWMGAHHTRLKVEGILELAPEGFGLIRSERYSFTPLPEDTFIPSFIMRKLQLRAGQRLSGFAKAPKDKEKYAAIDRVTHIEGTPIEEWVEPPVFDKLTALFPSERIILETHKDPTVTSRVVDLVAPLGKGQRGLIVASPRSGKTMVLKDIAKSIVANHPEITLIVLLLDERPEEVTDFEETVGGCEIYASTFDESPKRHTQVAELVSERAKRIVEMKKDVVILLDSITRLSRGYNSMQGGKGRTMSGGVDAKALVKPKKFFGAARNVEEGGSLTIIATALVETESRMDDLIFEEFKGTGNLEINLDREMAERRIYPAIHVTKSGTRRDDLLYHPDEFRRVGALRKALASVPAAEALENLIKNIQRTGSNAQLLLQGMR